MSKHLTLLFPRPQHVERTGAWFAVPEEPVIDMASPHLQATAEWLAELLRGWNEMRLFSQEL